MHCWVSLWEHGPDGNLVAEEKKKALGYRFLLVKNATFEGEVLEKMKNKQGFFFFFFLTGCFGTQRLEDYQPD